MKTFLSNAITASSAALLATLSYGVHAQSKQADPADPGMPVPALRYQSAFESYQPPGDETPLPAKNWRATNENIAKNGGMAMGMAKGINPGGMSMQMNGMKHDMKGMKEDERKGMQHGGMKGMQKDNTKGTMSMPMNDSKKGMGNMPMPNDPSQKR